MNLASPQRWIILTLTFVVGATMMMGEIALFTWCGA